MAIDSSGIMAAIEGGALIGLAAGGLYLTSGRIAGVSGIFGDVFTRTPAAWKFAFVVGLILVGFAGKATGAPVPHTLGAGSSMLAIAGLIVGLGTRLGNGCTSGHGVCGLARLSPRSLVAVAVFMVSAVATVYLTHHVLARGIAGSVQ